jgi:hypothetical protein
MRIPRVNRVRAAGVSALAIAASALATAAPASAAGPIWSSAIGSHTKTKCYTLLNCTMYVDYITFTAKSRSPEAAFTTST